MASRIARKEWMRGLPSAIGEGRYERKLVHSASERSVGYVFLIEESVQNHPNPHPYQTGSKGRSCGGRKPTTSPKRRRVTASASLAYQANSLSPDIARCPVLMRLLLL